MSELAAGAIVLDQLAAAQHPTENGSIFYDSDTDRFRGIVLGQALPFGLPGYQPIVSLTSTDDSSTFTQSTPLICTWDAETEKDSGFSHSNSTNPSRITVDHDGTYLFAASLRVTSSAARAQTVAKLIVNGVIQPQPYGSVYIRNAGSSSDYWTSVVNPPPLKLSAGDYVEVQIQVESQVSVAFAPTWIGSESSFSCIALTGEKGETGQTGPPGGQVKIACCPFGAKSDSLGKFLIANGKSSDGDDSSKTKTRQPIAIDGTLTLLAYQTKEANSGTVMKIHVNGSVEETVSLSSINANFSGVETIGVSVSAGDYVEIEYDSSQKPGECTMYFILEPS